MFFFIFFGFVYKNHCFYFGKFNKILFFLIKCLKLNLFRVPRLIFINKLDRAGANAWSTIDELKNKLNLNVAALQVPVGEDSNFRAIIDLVSMKLFNFEGKFGDKVIKSEIPENFIQIAQEKRDILIETIANNDSLIEEYYLNEKEIPIDILNNAIRFHLILSL